MLKEEINNIFHTTTHLHSLFCIYSRLFILFANVFPFYLPPPTYFMLIYPIR